MCVEGDGDRGHDVLCRGLCCYGGVVWGEGASGTISMCRGRLYVCVYEFVCVCAGEWVS